MNLGLFVQVLPQIIRGSVAIVDHIKGGSNKKKAVLEAIPAGLALAELGAGKDLLKDEAIAALVSDYIDAEAAVLHAKQVLQAGILAKQSPVTP